MKSSQEVSKVGRKDTQIPKDLHIIWLCFQGPARWAEFQEAFMFSSEGQNHRLIHEETGEHLRFGHLLPTLEHI